jgi:16S rRNA (cytosine1402-N4)-methyltransferase
VFCKHTSITPLSILMKHITVLLNEAVAALKLRTDSVVVDATLGAGGHARAILKCLGKAGTYIGLDADPSAIRDAKETLKSKADLHLVHRNFSQLHEVLQELKIEKVDAILADLGWRSEQFAEVGRGFSFNDNEGLLMTYGAPEDHLFTAYDIVNSWDEEDIANVIFGYGEERYSRRIAKAIVEQRRKSPITSALMLADIVSQSVPAGYKRGKINPATKTFQALRIAVNDEFSVLEKFIAQSWAALKSGGRISIISFHSLEDRIVKHSFRSLIQDHNGILVTKKPIVPTREEIINNPRARSAKLRVIEKI